MNGFELADLIRMNQLVRGQIDFAGFQRWYATLPPDERKALTSLLCEFAHQAGVTDATWEEALKASGLSTSDTVVQQLCDARRGEYPLFRLHEFVEALPDASLPPVFRLFVYLFGTAEGRVYRGESAEHCNHWWHRDLLDERVVQDLLNDPAYYMTSMKDDARIKARPAVESD